MEPVVAGPGIEVGWESEDDARMFAESFRERSPEFTEIRVVPEGQRPEDLDSA